MDRVLADLKALGVQYKSLEHPAVLTAEEQEKHIGSLSGAHTKNLFVSDKKHGARARARAGGMRERPCAARRARSWACRAARARGAQGTS